MKILTNEEMKRIISFEDVDVKKYHIGLRSGTTLFVVDKEKNVKYLTSGDLRTKWDETALASMDEAVCFTTATDLLIWIKETITKMFSGLDPSL